MNTFSITGAKRDPTSGLYQEAVDADESVMMELGTYRHHIN